MLELGITGSKASKIDGTYYHNNGIEGINEERVVFLSLPVLANIYLICLKLTLILFLHGS